jgi:hypothetical protein
MDSISLREILVDPEDKGGWQSCMKNTDVQMLNIYW